MIQGTASHVGKSVLVAALCRIFADDGVRVAPFKAQNMSNNSYVTPDGLEIGRAQAEQARAARLAPDVRMNPILLKPENDRRAQVVLMGKPAGLLSAERFIDRRTLWPHVASALDGLREEYELIVVEGAGSPAEINLRKGDLVNMRVARYASAPVLLVGDIDKGGVFAHLVGTLALLTPAERKLVQGFIINKFRGDARLLAPGLRMLERRARRPVIGVVPFQTNLMLAEEDAVTLQDTRAQGDGALEVRVIHLPHISNFDDFDDLAREPGVRLAYARQPSDLTGADLIILPGTKSTRGDLRWLRDRGIDVAVQRAVEDGAAVIGVCGGFQMLGEALNDPDGIDGEPGADEGLGLLPVVTEFRPAKVTQQVTAAITSDCGLLAGLEALPVKAYEIHMGVTSGACAQPLRVDRGASGETGVPDGALSADGFVLGTYLHGLFANDGLRHGVLENVASRRGKEGGFKASWNAEQGIDELARAVREALDMDALRKIAGL
jgi:adenosylcobyric acid synthase